MSKLVIRTYKDSGDLRRMQNITQSIWPLDPNYHIGDLAWQRYRHAGRENEWITAIWEMGDKLVAWGWIKLPDSLMVQVNPNFPEVSKDVIEWFDKMTKANEQRVTVLETESHLTSVLEDSLFIPLEVAPEVLSNIRLDGSPFPVNLPDGFKARHLKGDEDLTNRVRVHKAAFTGSLVTEESYRNVMNAYPYDASLDWVIESPDGEFAAFCLIWFDEMNKVGLLEPVGTDPRFGRMGLGSSVCKLALNALRDKGADTAIVVSTSPDTLEFYRSFGFEPFAQTKSFHRLKDTNNN